LFHGKCGIKQRKENIWNFEIMSDKPFTVNPSDYLTEYRPPRETGKLSAHFILHYSYVSPKSGYITDILMINKRNQKNGFKLRFFIFFKATALSLEGGGIFGSTDLTHYFFIA
jgi:hypothetical protein